MKSKITFNYIKLLLICGLFFIIAFIFLYIGNHSSECKDLAEDWLVRLELNDRIDWNAEKVFLEENGFYIKVTEKESGKVIYDNRDYTDSNVFGNLEKFHYSFKDKEHRFILGKGYEIYREDTFFEVDVFFNLSREFDQMRALLRNMVFVYLVIVIFVALQGSREIEDILKPIDEMSDTLNSMTVNNLHSERLSLEGTTDELKNLAIVCNDMLDRLETSMETQKQFASNASHELRTPIAVIQGYSNMLIRWGSKDEDILNESIEAISSESKSMQELVEKLLFLSRHDKNTLKLTKEVFDMGPIVEELVKETEMVVTDRNIECPVIEGVTVYGDKQSLKQAMRIFIENAVKYSEAGDTIRIACKNNRGDCELYIEDTGMGMKRRDVDKIFDRFYRSDDVRNKNIQGHGLGLSIARLIIVSHAGIIRLRTQYTKGTCFTVIIPKQKPAK